MPNFAEHWELDLFRINGEYWILSDKDGDLQLNQAADYTYLTPPIKYDVEWLGTVKVPYEYFKAEDGEVIAIS